MGKRAVTLKPVALADDGAVILATRAGARTGGYRVQVNDALLEFVHAAQELAQRQAEADAVPAAPVEPEPGPRVDSKLTPRDIQALLRQGKSVAAIAKKAGVEPEWVQRFEGPIGWERAGMATRAQRATLVRARRGASRLPLGEAVSANLRARAASSNGHTTEEWDAVRHPKKKSWIVTCNFSVRGRSGSARWEFDPENDDLEALSNLAGELGWVGGRSRKH